VATETLVFPDPPTLTNGNDSNQDYNLGIRFSVDEAVPCVGVRWVRTPDSVAATPNGGSWVAAIWAVVGETRIAFKNFTPTPATDDFDVLFDAPVMLEAAPTLYVASIFSRDYVYRQWLGGDASSPSGMVQGDEGRLSSSGDPTTYPSQQQAARYFVSPIIDLGGPEEHDTTGTAALTVGASAAVSTSRPSTGAAGLTATATAARTTSRSTTGRAELAAGASAARTTARTTAGVARVLLDAYGTQVRGGGGPRLSTVSRPRRLTSVTRPSSISTSTRG
jgi:hypothetical protein